MERKVRNREALLSRGDEPARRAVLDIVEATLQRLDARARIGSIARMEGAALCIGARRWDLTKKRHVYLLGAGKACNHMAMAVEEILGDYLTRGVIIVKSREATDIFRKTEVYVGGHPLPNEEGLRGCEAMLDLVDQAGPEDLFLVVISGGSSALMSYPVEGISLQDEIKATDVLLKSGAGILEINAVRRHISRMNGGRLAQRIGKRGAELIGFGISDAVGTPATGDIGKPYANYRGTPMGPDPTTLEDARRVIRDYDLRDQLPVSVVNYLDRAGEEAETPKAFPRNTYYLLNSLPDSCRYAKEAAESLGYRAVILSSFLEGEAAEAGTVLASIAREIQQYGNPVQAPCVLVAAGEVTTRIPDSAVITGHGGPGQELTCAFALAAEKIPGSALLSIDTEGTDGTTAAAGGLTDSRTAGLARKRGVDLHAALRGHGCYEALQALGGRILTGNTGTNLCDLHILYVPSLPEAGRAAGPRIKSVHARQIIDCKCRPMVEVDVVTEDGVTGTGAAPTGSSVGMYESCVLRDADPGEYHGLSVHRAVDNVNRIIAPKLIGMDVTDQAAIDRRMLELDGTPDKHVLGGNAVYSVSVAAYRAAAASRGVPLYDYMNPGGIRTVPIPSFNVLNGGDNAGVRQAFNEFLVMPFRAKDIEEAVEIAVEVFQELGKVIRDRTGAPARVGGSYGWCAPYEDPAACLDLIDEAIGRCGYRGQCAFALDCASSEMYDPEKGYYLNGNYLTSAELVAYAKGLTERYNFVFIEDLLDENDWEGYQLAHREITRTLIIADDLTVSNRERIARAHESGSIDGFILKPNQVGTITEALEAQSYAREHGLLSITSGRSGGVVGDVVMDLAVGLQIPFIKNGCPRSGERIDKLNFLMRVKDTHPGCHMAHIEDLVRF